MSLLVKKTKVVKYQVGSYGELSKRGERDVRTTVILGFFILMCLGIVFRLVKLQLFEHNYYVALASDQHEIFQQLIPERGTIFLQDKAGVLVDKAPQTPVAINKKLYLLYAVPKDIGDPAETLEALKEVFNLKELAESKEPPKDEATMTKEELELKKSQEKDAALIETWRTRLAKKGDPYEQLKHFVTDEEIEKIKKYNLPGLHWTKEVTRYYPEKNIGSQLLGFVGKQSENNLLKGSYGVEGCYDKELAGTAGFLRSESDMSGRWIATAQKDFMEAENGHDLILTIDKSIQYFACDALNKTVEQYQAESGSVIVYEPQTGKILALCNAPDYDPNKYNEVEDIKVFNNLALNDNYEPGSVFKAITVAAGIDTGKIDPFSGYEDVGELNIDGFKIYNSDKKAHGWQTMTQVLEKSLNTGTVFIANKVGLEDFKKYVEGFGFGKKTDVDLCQEGSGNLNSLTKKADVYLATASFGQGITVTPIQMIKAYGAIYNEGKLMQPYIIDSVVDKDGKVLKKTVPKVVSQVISPQTAKLVSSMLVSVVDNGHSKGAAMSGYRVGGKTGTAQIPDLEHGGYSDKTAHTFVGSAPNNNPRFVMLTRIMAPKDVQFAESTAAPLFKQIAEFILNYYEVPPEK